MRLPCEEELAVAEPTGPLHHQGGLQSAGQAVQTGQRLVSVITIRNIVGLNFVKFITVNTGTPERAYFSGLFPA